MPDDLTIYAGVNALRVIKEQGLRQEHIRTVASAAGGPKWLVLNHLDRYLFSEFLQTRQDPLNLVGASIGAWRFAALAQDDPMAALDRFEDAYITQSYNKRPTPADVTAESRRIMDVYLGEGAVNHILGHPFLRLSIMTVRCRGLAATEKKIPLAIGLGAAALANAVHRKLLGIFFERALFHDPREALPFPAMDLLPIHRIPLGRDNFREALLASGSIPLVMAGVADIPGAPRGMYRDGGVTDYHLDVPLSGGDQGLVLFPHYMPRIIPGWFDKKLSWRKPDRFNMANVVVVSPSEAFIRNLPHGKIPDRNDFWLFEGRDEERFNYWRTVVSESRRLADAFQDAVESGRIKDLVVPLETG